MYLYGKLKHTVWSVFVSDENLTEMFETSYRNKDVVFFKILFDYLFIFQWEWISLTQFQLWSRCACSCVSSFTFTYPSTARIVGTSQMPSQPVSSIFPCSPLPSGTWRTPGLSIPWCCLPTSSFVRLVFFPLSLCLARWFWPDPMNGKHDHTTAVCVSLRSSGALHVVQLPAGSWHELPHW